MKKKLLLLCLYLLSLNAQSQDAIDAKSLGFVSYLTYVKSISEHKMTSLIKDENYKKMPDKAQQFNSEYNLLKLSCDQLINQLCADLFRSNKLRLYKRLDKYLKYKTPLPDKFKHYGILIDQIDGQLTSFSIKKFNGGTLAGPGLEAIMGVITEGREIITSARDFREKKIQSLSSLIKELKLVELSELSESKNESKD